MSDEQTQAMGQALWDLSDRIERSIAAIRRVFRLVSLDGSVRYELEDAIAILRGEPTRAEQMTAAEDRWREKTEERLIAPEFNTHHPR